MIKVIHSGNQPVKFKSDIIMEDDVEKECKKLVGIKKM